jgi:hypothetical protein
MRHRRGRALRRRYGRASASSYTHRQAPANALQENVYADGELIGTVTLHGKGSWRWHTDFIPYGGHYHPYGVARTMKGGVARVIAEHKATTAKRNS